MICHYPNAALFYKLITIRTIVAAMIDTGRNTIEVMKYPSIALEGIIIDMIYVSRTKTLPDTGLILTAGILCHLLSDYLHKGPTMNPIQEIVRVYAYGLLTISHVIIMAAF